VQRTGQRKGLEMRAAAGTVKHFDFEIAVENEVTAGAELFEEIERLVIAAHQDVLTVIDEITGLGIVE